ncbi:MAG: hypothetical protein LBI03_00330 [Clostridiales bacterium]|jgi:hypothetical protein|nr:hypothetical protein [Clostridiales bacterium]
MKKHGISEQDLNDNIVTTHEFKFKGKREHSLLMQVLYKVFGDTDWKQYTYSRNGRKIPYTIGIDCTPTQKIEIDFLFCFYKELYHREEKIFFDAFILKHSLFGIPKNGNSKHLSQEELLKMKLIMKGMENTTPYKQIGDGNDNK